MPGKTLVVRNEGEIIKSIEEFQLNTKRIWCACVDASLPSFSVTRVKPGYLKAKERGVRIMYITEITRQNLKYCREILTFAELRHLDGVKGNFALSETEYIAGIMRGNSLASLVRSSVEELVMQQHLVFEMLWQMAIPADKKVAELSHSF